jgi:hypothetical protein
MEYNLFVHCFFLVGLEEQYHYAMLNRDPGRHNDPDTRRFYDDDHSSNTDSGPAEARSI